MKNGYILIIKNMNFNNKKYITNINVLNIIIKKQPQTSLLFLYQFITYYNVDLLMRKQIAIFNLLLFFINSLIFL